MGEWARDYRRQKKEAIVEKILRRWGWAECRVQRTTSLLITPAIITATVHHWPRWHSFAFICTTTNIFFSLNRHFTGRTLPFLKYTHTHKQRHSFLSTLVAPSSSSSTSFLIIIKMQTTHTGRNRQARTQTYIKRWHTDWVKSTKTHTTTKKRELHSSAHLKISEREWSIHPLLLRSTFTKYYGRDVCWAQCNAAPSFCAVCAVAYHQKTAN